MMPSRTERLDFWRDEYAIQSFNDLQRLLPFMVSESEQTSQMRIWLTVCATVLYARPFRQRGQVRLAEEEVPLKYRAAHKEILLHRDKVIAHRDPDPHKEGVWGNELPIVSKGNDLFIPTTSPAMNDKIARDLLELVEILIPRLKARTASFINRYLPELLEPGDYLVSVGDDRVEWLRKASPAGH